MKDQLKNLEKEITHLKSQNIDTKELENSFELLKKQVRQSLTPWDRVQIARDKDRPNALVYIDEIFEDFIELHGDRYYRDDGAIVGGIARLDGTPVTVIAVVKGKTTEENIHRNFGMVHPEGYRKALRLMKQAEKFHRPIITLIDTPGAYPGIGAEERGQGEAIAQNLLQMMELSVPTISIVLGEAGSGGALALSVTNEIWMLENAIYSILSPEGFASILFKDASKAKDIVDLMKITSYDLKNLGIIENIFEEDENLMLNLKGALIKSLAEYSKMKPAKLLKLRYEKFRNIGDVIYEPQNS